MFGVNVKKRDSSNKGPGKAIKAPKTMQDRGKLQQKHLGKIMVMIPNTTDSPSGKRDKSSTNKIAALAGAASGLNEYTDQQIKMLYQGS
jgi:hypothetical protein